MTAVHPAPATSEHSDKAAEHTATTNNDEIHVNEQDAIFDEDTGDTSNIKEILDNVRRRESNVNSRDEAATPPLTTSPRTPVTPQRRTSIPPPRPFPPPSPRLQGTPVWQELAEEDSKIETPKGPTPQKEEKEPPTPQLQDAATSPPAQQLLNVGIRPVTAQPESTLVSRIDTHFDSRSESNINARAMIGNHISIVEQQPTPSLQSSSALLGSTAPPLRPSPAPQRLPALSRPVAASQGFSSEYMDSPLINTHRDYAQSKLAMPPTNYSVSYAGGAKSRGMNSTIISHFDDDEQYNPEEQGDISTTGIGNDMGPDGSRIGSQAGIVPGEGLDGLAHITKLYLHKIGVWECDCHSGKFSIYDGTTNEPLYYAREDAGCCGICRLSVMTIHDSNNFEHVSPLM